MSKEQSQITSGNNEESITIPTTMVIDLLNNTKGLREAFGAKYLAGLQFYHNSMISELESTYRESVKGDDSWSKLESGLKVIASFTAAKFLVSSVADIEHLSKAAKTLDDIEENPEKYSEKGTQNE